ncbi:Replication factor-A carboxy-terminal domain protein [Arachis hypogaea]|uniref:Replication factor-A carboxy-terminal domain protein n=1 Tax=Arachis hypogaea TaxID=3818 RepID=A0A6B9VE47_ARAHY|nr:Replication factor-A carboxy-terminal domain protein [Arachis hypogaea]
MQGVQQKRILQALPYRVAHFSAISSDKMSIAIDALRKISPWKEAWIIEHHKIQATVEDDLIGTFIDQSKEGKVFIISEFKVIPNRGLVRVTRHRFRIIFKCSTSVVAAANFVGVLCGLKKRRDVECNGKILKVLTLEVFADGKKISCNFVGDCPALIDMNTLKRYQRPPVVILQYFKIKVNGDKVSLQSVINIFRVLINLDMQEAVNFLNQYGIASHHFSRLRSNEVGDLVCVIDDESFDWKLIRTIDNLKANNEDGQFFVVGKIKEIVEDPEWWFFSCVCGHPIVGDDNVFHCQLCSREVQHFMIRLILIEDGTSLGIFVLLDSPATKLLGRTCSDVFLLLEDEIDRISTQGYYGTFKVINVISDARFFNKLQADQCIKDVSSDSGFSPIFEDFSRYGQLRSYENQVISGVPIQLHSIKEMLADILCAKIYSSASRNDQICFLIGEIIDVLKHQKWWYYCCLCNAPVSHVGNVFYCYLCRVECVDAIRRYRIKIIVSHSNGSNIFILEDDESTDDYTIPNGMISQLMNKKIVFIVDPRHVGYELNTSLHVVYAVCDDVEIVKFLEDSSHDNQQQKFDLDPFVPHFPFEFKNPVQFHSNASIQCSSSSNTTVGQASPISILNWNCWTVNHDFHARISSSQGSNLFGSHQPLTIREEL